MAVALHTFFQYVKWSTTTILYGELLLVLCINPPTLIYNVNNGGWVDVRNDSNARQRRRWSMEKSVFYSALLSKWEEMIYVLKIVK